MVALLISFSIGLLVLTSPAAKRVDFPTDPAQWYVTERPAEGSEQALIASEDAEHEWVVTLNEAGPRVDLRKGVVPTPLPFEIKPSPGFYGRRISVKVEDGWIVAINHGEFGAGLWWFSPDGGRRYNISDDSVVSLIPTSTELLAIEGLAHGGVSEGKIVRLYRDKNGRWCSEAFLDLGHAPYVAVKDSDGSVIVVTSERLLRFVPTSRKLVVLLDHVFWRGLYPNSMVITRSGTIYVGMRHGIAKVEKDKMVYKLWWLLPNKAFLEQKHVEKLK